MKRPVPISVAVVCQDEEDRIGACLESARFADEIVVVDSGSRDRTLELAREFTDRIFTREWKGWKDQKAWAANQCRNEWVFTLDADEVISEELREELEELFAEGEPRENGFTVPRKTFYRGKWMKRCGWYPDRKLRLYRKSLARFAGDDPHEVIEVPPPVGALRHELFHYTYRDFAHHARQITRYALVNAEARAERGAKATWFDLGFRPVWAFLKCYFFQLGFLEGLSGFLVSVMNGYYYTFVKYARLLELSRKNRE